MKLLCIIIVGISLFSCSSVGKNKVDSQDSKYLNKLKEFYTFVELENHIEARNCFANVCSVFSFSKNSDRSEISEMIQVYQVYIRAGFQEKVFVDKLSKKPLSSILSKYSYNCSNSLDSERCVFIYLANKNKVDCIFERKDEKKLSIVKMSCEEWADKPESH